MDKASQGAHPRRMHVFVWLCVCVCVCVCVCSWLCVFETFSQAVTHHTGVAGQFILTLDGKKFAKNVCNAI